MMNLEPGKWYRDRAQGTWESAEPRDPDGWLKGGSGFRAWRFKVLKVDKQTVEVEDEYGNQRLLSRYICEQAFTEIRLKDV